MKRIGRALLLGLLVSCGGLTDRETLPAEGQILVAVTTDAWLPRGPDDPREEIESIPLFDRLRVELFEPGAIDPCRDCTRDFSIDRQKIDSGRGSIGFVPRKGVSGYRARVRLFRTGPSESFAEPRIRATLEAVLALPPVSADGIVPIHVVLHTDDLGRPRGTLDAPVAADPGPAPTGLVNTWHADARRACPEPGSENEACVPGGAFWMGDPSFSIPFERLVVVSPFYLDLREVTVAELRASGVARPGAGGVPDPAPQTADPTKRSHYCTWTSSPGPNEQMPINCVGREVAAAHCAKLGRRLPSEAESEFISRARRDATYPWGEQVATCADAIFGRAWDTTKPPEWRSCLGGATVAGVAKAGSGKLDRVTTPDGKEIVDLAANLAEWMADAYTPIDGPCLTENPAIDPLCTTPSNPGTFLLRGSSWALPGGGFLFGAERTTTVNSQDEEIGFRCARDAK